MFTHIPTHPLFSRYLDEKEFFKFTVSIGKFVEHDELIYCA
jgi:hypothetical protein